MANSTSKLHNNPKKSRGRQSAFSGEKEVFLDGLADVFWNTNDRSAFYDDATQGLIDRFGYSRDGKVYVEEDTLNPEEKRDYYQTLRHVSARIAIRYYGNAYATFF